MLHSNASKKESQFIIVDRRLLRNARNSLLRVVDMENSNKLGLLGEDAKKLAQEFEEILQGKNY